MASFLPALVLPVIKNRGMTSFDVVRSLKRKKPREWKKIGHFGTLDPFAQGLMLIGVNSALRANQYVQDFSPKVYLAVGKLGEKSDTGDDTGKIIEHAPVDESKFGDVQLRLDSFIGEYWQQPPYYSATKHKGRPLYEWAREGTFIEKPQVKREIYSLKLIEISSEQIKFEVSVSSGTYIRRLVEDIAKELGTIAHLNFLERSSIGSVTLEQAVPEEVWLEAAEGQDFWLNNAMPINHLIPLDKIICNTDTSYINGIPLTVSEYTKEETEKPVNKELLWVFGTDGKLLGMGTESVNGCIKSIFNLPVS